MVERTARFFRVTDRDKSAQPESVENEAWPELYRVLDRIHDSEFSDELLTGRQRDEVFYAELYDTLSISATLNESKTERQQRESAAIKELFDRKHQAGETLSLQQTANIIYELKCRGDFAGLVDVFEASNVDSPVIKEFYAVALNKIGRLDESNAELEKLRDEEGAKVGEIAGILGKVYKLKSEKCTGDNDATGAIENMATSVRELERGFYDTYEFYPGINLVYNRIKLAELSDSPELINAAFNDAELVMLAARKAGAEKTSDYWTAATLLESSVFTGEINDDYINHCIETYENDWELDSTISNLESIAETIRGFQSKPELDDAMRDRLSHTVDAITKDDGVLSRLKTALESAHIKTGVDARGADTILDFGFMYGETTTLIGGNIQFGGQLQSHIVNRFDTGVAKILIDDFGIDKVESTTDFNAIVDRMLRQQFRTDELEDLHAPTHEIYDDQIKKLLDVVGVTGDIDKKMVDSRTNIMVDLMLGRGDCRQHAHAKQLIFDTWKTNRLNQLLGTLRRQQMSGDGIDETRFKIDELLSTQMMVFDSTIESTVKMNSLYDPVKNENGQYVISKDFEPIEEHTWTGLVRLDKNGGVESLEMADAFYQHEYGLGGKGQIAANPEDYAGDGMFVTEIDAVDDDGNHVKVPVRLKPTIYAGDRGKRALTHCDTGSAHLRGIDLGGDIPNVARVIDSAKIRDFWEEIIRPQVA
ncbi:MAG: DUF4071 domain-containing protein [Candidatus Nomurabacteria bacterium]|nr:DUF4071 domain-containing protein [Candidatus Nomurabacteria bacterium]